MSVLGLSSFQYPMDDRRGDKDSDHNLAGVDVDEQGGENAYQNNDE